MTTALVYPQPRRAPLGLIGCLTALVGALALCANRALNGDVYLQLLGGRFVAEHGFVSSDPFPTIAAGHAWHNQQWLAELTMYAVTRTVGLTGLTVLYALLLAAPLLVLLLRCRDRGAVLLVGGAALYFPALLAIIHPRAAALTLVCFTLLTLLLWRLAVDPARASWRPFAAIVALFALWANLHGGFVSGLLAIALVAAGAAIDRRRGLAGGSAGRLALAGGAAFAATLATPLGPAVWSYVSSFSNSALSLASTEWQPVWHSALACVYVVAAGGFAAFLHARGERPRRLMPLIVTVGLLAATVFSLRNMIVVPAALFMQMRSCRRVPSPVPVRSVAQCLAAATVAAAALWALVLGPAGTPRYLSSRPVRYALAHPAPGRVAAIAGVGSYLLWRSPVTAVVLDGWLEHFSSAQLRDDYAVVRSGAAAPLARLGVAAVITSNAAATRRLERQGFTVEASDAHGGSYLVRGAKLCLNRAPCRR